MQQAVPPAFHHCFAQFRRNTKTVITVLGINRFRKYRVFPRVLAMECGGLQIATNHLNCF